MNRDLKNERSAASMVRCIFESIFPLEIIPLLGWVVFIIDELQVMKKSNCNGRTMGYGCLWHVFDETRIHVANERILECYTSDDCL